MASLRCSAMVAKCQAKGQILENQVRSCDPSAPPFFNPDEEHINREHKIKAIPIIIFVSHYPD